MENLEKLNKQNLIFFYALFAGQAIFLLIAAYLLKTSGPQAPHLAASFQIALPLITLAGIFGSLFIAKFLLKSIKSLINDTEKLNKYRTALLVRLAFLEGANLFAIVVFLLTGSNLALIISSCLLILFILNKPSVERLKEDLEIK
jgi:F0F1-type ATP synthase membrane subunit c/vacuolar-type H+-ATPase subunit K